VRATATSAARDASNREDFFAAAEAALGVRPELLPGDEEGRLAFRGSHLAQWGPPLPRDFVGPRPDLALGARLVRGLATNDELRLRKLAATARALGR